MTNLHRFAEDDLGTNGDPLRCEVRDWVVWPRDVAAHPDEFMQDLVRATSEVMGINKEDLVGRRQVQCCANARHAATLVARFYPETPIPYPQIGRAFGRDHTSMISGHKRGVALATRNAHYLARINTIARLLKNKGWGLRGDISEALK